MMMLIMNGDGGATYNMHTVEKISD